MDLCTPQQPQLLQTGLFHVPDGLCAGGNNTHHQKLLWQMNINLRIQNDGGLR